MRRYLGALLALGFGATWWSFMPPATAATPPADAQQRAARRAPSAEVQRVTSVPARTDMPTHPDQIVAVATPPIDHTPRHPRTKHRPVIVKRPPKPPAPPVVDPPVVEPQTPPIVETLPVVEPQPPVVETPPAQDPVDEPTLPPIRTRSS